MKKVVAVVIATLMVAVLMTGCTESEQVSYNIGKEADNFNVTRKLTVINARTDTILLEMEGTFSLSNNSDNELESEFQQQPFEAKGILFPEKSLNRYFELPIDRDPDSIIAVCDTADTGDDFCAMPIAAVYGSEVYIVDVVFDDSVPEVTKPECAKALIDNKVVASTFESNNAGKYFARDVQQILTDRKYVCNIRTKQTISNKQTRIEFASDNILKKFYFKDPSLYARNSQYAAFLKQVTTYTRSGKVPHDDAPDSLALLENELRGLIGNTVEIMDRRV